MFTVGTSSVEGHAADSAELVYHVTVSGAAVGIEVPVPGGEPVPFCDLDFHEWCVWRWVGAYELN